MADIHANLNSDEKMKHLDILNIYELNLYQILNMMFRVKTNSLPETLQNKFKIIECNYCARYSEYNFKELCLTNSNYFFLRCLVIMSFGFLRASCNIIDTDII